MASLVPKYKNLLASRPILTNVVTTGFLFGAGDVLAQNMENKPQMAKDTGNNLVDAPPFLDFVRLSRAVIYGSVVFAPLGDRWYRVLNKVNVSSSKIINTCACVALDQLVFAPFIGIPLYYSAMTAMEGGRKEDIRLKLLVNWWSTLTANWTVWPAVQTLNFAFIPVQLRLLVVNSISIVWNCYLLMRMSSSNQDSIFMLQ